MIVMVPPHRAFGHPLPQVERGKVFYPLPHEGEDARRADEGETDLLKSKAVPIEVQIKVVKKIVIPESCGQRFSGMTNKHRRK